MRKVIAGLLIFNIAAPAQAFFDAGVTQTFGSNSYRGTRAFVDVGGDWHIRPALSVYRSDVSDGTYKTFSARGGYDTKIWGAGVTMGASPKTSGYSNRFFGADVAFSLTPGGDRPIRRIPSSPEGQAPKGKGLARIDIGGAILHTTHRDEFQTGRRRRTVAVNVGQTDFSVNGGVSVLDTLLSAEFTASAYDKDLTAIAANPSRTTRLAGLNEVVSGFPNTSLNLRAELGMLPVVEPYVSFTHTTFKLGSPDSKAWVVGASAGFEILEVHGSYERYLPGGGSAAQNYVSMGAGVRF